MIKIINYISLVLWGIFFALALFRESKKENNGLFIRFSSVIFLLIFLFYNHFTRGEVKPYVYLAIVLINIVYLLYDMIENNLLSFNPKLGIEYLIGAIVISLAIAGYALTENVVLIAKITLTLNIFIPLLNRGIKFIKNH